MEGVYLVLEATLNYLEATSYSNESNGKKTLISPKTLLCKETKLAGAKVTFHQARVCLMITLLQVFLKKQ